MEELKAILENMYKNRRSLEAIKENIKNSFLVDRTLEHMRESERKLEDILFEGNEI